MLFVVFRQPSRQGRIRERSGPGVRRLRAWGLASKDLLMKQGPLEEKRHIHAERVLELDAIQARVSGEPQEVWQAVGSPRSQTSRAAVHTSGGGPGSAPWRPRDS
eukprot:scaffold429_cov269-Pinguiococcus_pyrenoidosus.AAC.28